MIDPETQSLYEDDRVRRLQFADGSKGFFIVWGEPCYLTLIKGELVLQIEAYDDKSLVTIARSDQDPI